MDEESRVSINPPMFDKNKFFFIASIKLGVQFRSVVLAHMSNMVPIGKMDLGYRTIGERMSDNSMLSLIKGHNLFTPDELAGVLYFGLVISMGDRGLLRKNGKRNTFYVDIDGRIFATYAYFDKSEGVNGIWHLGANLIDDKVRSHKDRRLIYKV